MKKILCIGEYASQKEKIISFLLGNNTEIPRPMTLSYHAHIINSPAEFIENKMFFHALITASFACDIVCIAIHEKQKSSLLLPKFAQMFNKPVFGIISHETDTVSPEKARIFLENAGVEKYFLLNIQSGNGLEDIKSFLQFLEK